jgi:hypothetical protein
MSPGEPFHLRTERPIEWLQNWYLLREQGRALIGPAAVTLVPPITWAEFLDATRDYAAGIAARSLHDAGAGSVAYAVLTMCRAAATLTLGRAVSKQEGAAWAVTALPWSASLIEEALHCRRSGGTIGLDGDGDRTRATSLLDALAERIAGITPADPPH